MQTGQQPPGKVGVSAAEFMLSAPDARHFPKLTAPEVAMLGRSNVGKSSLLNFMANRKGLARVSNTPGRTRDINFFKIDLVSGVNRHTIHLVDLPGYGFAELSKTEKARLARLIADYAESGRPACACLLLDIRRDLGDHDLEIWGLLQGNEVPTIPVITKSDKVAKNQRKPRVASIARDLGVDADEMVITSAEEGVGREDLYKRIWGHTHSRGLLA